MKWIIRLLIITCALPLSTNAQGLIIENGISFASGGPGFLVIGDPLQDHLAFDYNTIQALEENVISSLKINPMGGSISIGHQSHQVRINGNMLLPNGSSTLALNIRSGPDVSLTSDGYMMLGSAFSRNLAFDDNEIQARENGKASSLFLNHDGGALFCRGLRGIGNMVDMQYDTFTGEIGYDNSSRRYKSNITSLHDDWDKILYTRPVQYNRPKSPDRWEFGYIAEEFHEIGLSNLVQYDQEGIPFNVNYRKMVIYLTEIVKMQNDRIAQLENKIN